jgi:hypothetical protein
MITDKLRKSLENATTKYLIPDLARLKLWNLRVKF